MAAGVFAAFAFADAMPAAAQQIELQIRSPAADDDYLTWAPAPARIRQVPSAQAVDRRVVLTNDPEQPIPAGRKQPLDGNVAFAKSVAVGATATEPSLELVLPKDGTWVGFLVAGSFPRASTEDKDAIIEVHDGTAAGAILHRHAAMVRIRKDHRDLTDTERNRFLNALAALDRKAHRYERMVGIHELSSMGQRLMPGGYFWPDLGHAGSAFLAWHRAYLLLVERELQKIDPAVTLPYWKMETLPSVFEENFMGANPVTGDLFVEPTFAANHPLAHWSFRGQVLQRFPIDRRDAQDLKERFTADDVLFQETEYRFFRRRLQSNPHNEGHNWTGPWMQNCMVSPSDPVFWPFHTGFDRQWAKWQWLGGRLRPDGSGESYFPNDAYDGSATGCNVATPNACMPIGHHLKDTMWPWNSEVGPGPTVKANRPPQDLSQQLIGPFPVSAIPGLWPAAPAVPIAGDMIDYAGTTQGRLDMGFGYDDVPYGAKPAQEIAAPGVPGIMPWSVTFADRARTVAERIEAGRALARAPHRADAPAVLAIVGNRDEPEAVRLEALRILGGLDDARAAPAAARLLAEDGLSAALGVGAVEALNMQMMFAEMDPHAHHEIMAALQRALSNAHVEVRRAAVRSLASHRDPVLVRTLLDGLKNPTDRTIPASDAIRALMVAGAARDYASELRAFLAATDVKTRTAAVIALAGDPGSRTAISGMLVDAGQPAEVRSAALRGLAAAGPEATPQILDFLRRENEQPALRQEAAAALAASIESFGGRLEKAQLDEIARGLGAVRGDAGLAAALGRALKATDEHRTNPR